MQKRELVYEGKAKKLYTTDDPDLLIQYFKDDATAFNAKKRGTIVEKGVINNRMSEILEGLRVYPERMRENMERSFGLMYSQRVLLRLTETGLPRQRAYEIVQRNAMRAWSDRTSFRDLLAADPEVTARLAPAALAECFDPAWYLRNVDAIYRRLNLI